MILIKTKPYNLPSYDAIEEFQNSFFNIEQKYEVNTKTERRIIQKLIQYSPKMFKYLKFNKKYDDIFTILMSPHDIYKLFPLGFLSKRKHIYIYDLWQPEYKYFEKCLYNLDISSVFFSSRQTYEYFNKNIKDLNTNFYWIPEAITPKTYKYLDYDNKDIDILSFGRKYDYYHKSIIDYTEKNNITYIYQKDKIVFPDKISFIEGLSKSKISICFPASTTHKDTVGDISKITMRYFQSMASKCLILGKAPKDMKYLFDYNPIIEIDEKNSCEQLKEILYNYKDYIPLIEKNYREVTNKHLYENRVNEILSIINNN